MSPSKAADRPAPSTTASWLSIVTESAGSDEYNAAQPSWTDIQIARTHVLTLVDNTPADKPIFWNEVVKAAGDYLRTARKDDAPGWALLSDSQYLFHLSQRSTHGYPPDWAQGDYSSSSR